MSQLTNSQRIEMLKAATNLIFQFEGSYIWYPDDTSDIRHDEYRIRILVGNLIQRIQDNEKQKVTPAA